MPTTRSYWFGLGLVLSPLDHFLNLWMISYENVSLDEPFKPKKDAFITQNLTETRGQND